jgi:hypothetical protein
MSDRPAPPSAEDLTQLLGATYDLWAALQRAIRDEYAPATERWVYGGAKYGWSCRVERGKKGILYMTPDAGHFRVGMALSDAGREAAIASKLPAEIREGLTTATRAMEGWPVRMVVRTAENLAAVLGLAAIKLSS